MFCSTLMNVPEDKASQTSAATSGLGLASIILGSGITGLAIGYALDQWLGSSPKALVICFFLFMASGFYHMIKVSSK